MKNFLLLSISLFLIQIQDVKAQLWEPAPIAYMVLDHSNRHYTELGVTNLGLSLFTAYQFKRNQINALIDAGSGSLFWYPYDFYTAEFGNPYDPILFLTQPGGNYLDLLIGFERRVGNQSFVLNTGFGTQPLFNQNRLQLQLGWALEGQGFDFGLAIRSIANQGGRFDLFNLGLSDLINLEGIEPSAQFRMNLNNTRLVHQIGVNIPSFGAGELLYPFFKLGIGL